MWFLILLTYYAIKGINFQNNLPKCNQIKILTVSSSISIKHVNGQQLNKGGVSYSSNYCCAELYHCVLERVGRIHKTGTRVHVSYSTKSLAIRTGLCIRTKCCCLKMIWSYLCWQWTHSPVSCTGRQRERERERTSYTKKVGVILFF